jgi:hypothetical protein
MRRVGCILFGVLLLLGLAGLYTALVGPGLGTPPEKSSVPTVERLEVGRSARRQVIEAYQFGNGLVKLALIGAIHGGYEYNTRDLLLQSIEYFKAHLDQVPPDVSLVIIPTANPDGTGAGTDLKARVNGNGVDLNRNWDCQWSPEAQWRNQPVDPGDRPFSEPESQALRDFLIGGGFTAVIFYHSQAAEIYAGGRCGGGQPSEALAQRLAEATGYRYDPTGVGYPVTGDSIDYLAAKGIAAIEIELTNHEDPEWGRNLRGVQTFVQMYSRGVPPPEVKAEPWQQMLTRIQALARQWVTRLGQLLDKLLSRLRQ